MTENIIRITSDRRRGTWAAETVRESGRTTRNASRIASQTNTSASSHTLLALALTSALKTFPRKLAVRETVTVSTDDLTFCQAMTALISRDMQQLRLTPLRAGKNTLVPLARQLSRFTVVFETDQEENREKCFALRKWLRDGVRDPKESLEPILSPSSVSELFWKKQPNHQA